MTQAAMTAAQGPEFRAAGTDLSERRRSGVSTGPLIDIAAQPDMTSMLWSADGTLRIGAFTTIAAIAGDDRIAAAYPGLAASALGLATPQIRHLATLGGNLAQRSRCWYYRNPQIACLKKGGSDCPARLGNHLYGVAFDLGPCVAPHPSTLAAALLAYDATIVTDQRGRLTTAELFGAPCTSAPSAARMRNGRWSRSAPAPWSRMARFSSSASPPAASPQCRCGYRPSKPRCRASRRTLPTSPAPRRLPHQAQSRCR